MRVCWLPPPPPPPPPSFPVCRAPASLSCQCPFPARARPVSLRSEWTYTGTSVGDVVHLVHCNDSGACPGVCLDRRSYPFCATLDPSLLPRLRLRGAASFSRSRVGAVCRSIVANWHAPCAPAAAVVPPSPPRLPTSDPCPPWLCVFLAPGLATTWLSQANPDPNVFVVDSARNAIIVCPDNLVSPSKITGSISCLRRTVLSDIVSYAASEGKSALVGTVCSGGMQTQVMAAR
jgi:hypothetical protein